MRFTKMHGAGNDYVLMDARDYVLMDARDMEEDWSSLARAMCDRHMGVGADGMLLVLPSNEAEVRMRMLNPDGSEAEMCGNGIRCLAKYVLEREIAEIGRDALSVETLNGIRLIEPVWPRRPSGACPRGHGRA